MEFKYVMIKTEQRGQLKDSPVIERWVPILFPAVLVHSDVARRMIHGMGCDQNLMGTTVSAGFCRFVDEGVECYGRSESLNLDSRPEIDSRIISEYHTMSGIVRPADLPKDKYQDTYETEEVVGGILQKYGPKIKSKYAQSTKKRKVPGRC